MPYSTKYSEEKHSVVEKYLEKYESLSRPKPIFIETPSLEEAKRLTWLFHDFFHLTGLTPIYSVKQIMTHVVLSKGKPTLSLTTSLGGEQQDFSRQFTTLVRELISSPSPNEAIHRLVDNVEISKGTLSALLAEYSRVMES